MSKYIVCAQAEYIDGRFEGGLVFESAHDENEVYLRFTHNTDEGKEWIHELTPREGAVLIMCLSAALVGRESALEDILYGDENSNDDSDWPDQPEWTTMVLGDSPDSG